MNSSWFGNRGRNGWLLPLVIGLGIGALLFGLLPGLHWGPPGRGQGRFGRGDHPSMYRQPLLAQDAERVEPGQEARSGHGHGSARAWSGHRSRGIGDFLFPFGINQLILPLALIGTGAWLLSRRRTGPAGHGPTTGNPAPSSSPAVPPAEPGPHTDPEFPTTGETRRLNRTDEGRDKWL